MIYIESPCNDPRFNLALEQYVFDHMDRNNGYFMLWQNHNTIVVGKHQNTAEEVNQAYVDSHNITVVRRLSGGGAVYHDMGNLNFTFILDSGDMEKLNFNIFCKPVVNALAQIGVTAKLNGRNDITIDGKKISGNSQYIRRKRIMHHGTILFNSDLSIIAEALNVPAHKIQSKGIKSVRSRVTNISDYLTIPITLGKFKTVLLREIFGSTNIVTHKLGDEEMEKVAEIQKSRYDLWEWNYGYSPKYDVEKRRWLENCGECRVYMDVREGIINRFEIKGDFFGSGDLQDIYQRVTGCPVRRSTLCQALNEVDMGHYINNLTLDEFVDIIIQ